jgi:ankyrin repeat protein
LNNSENRQRNFSIPHSLLNAAYNGQIESAKVLLEFGANKTIRNAAGLTPAELAAARAHSELAALLAGG